MSFESDRNASDFLPRLAVFHLFRKFSCDFERLFSISEILVHFCSRRTKDLMWLCAHIKIDSAIQRIFLLAIIVREANDPTLV